MRPRTINHSIDLQEEEKTACLAETACFLDLAPVWEETKTRVERSLISGEFIDILKMH